MGDFGKALKEERKRARKTLRETSDGVGLSVSYISDMEQGRTGPPDLENVRRFQEYLSVEQDRLLILAEKERGSMPSQIVQDLQGRPKLRELFFRLRGMGDKELVEWINKSTDE